MKRRAGVGTRVRQITMGDIADLAGLATSTVSRALAGDSRIGSKTRERVQALARKHGYAVNANARKLRSSRSNTIAVVIHLPLHAGPDWPGPFVFQLLANVANQLWLRGQDLLLCSPKSDDPLAYRSLLAAKGADGIVVLGQGTDPRWLGDLAATRAPIVVWGAVDDDAPYCTVGSDNVRGGLLAAERFASLRRTRPWFVGNRTHPEMARRLEGFERGLKDHGGTELANYVEVEDFTFETALGRMREALSEANSAPDAVFAGSDEIGLAVLAAASAEGLEVPDQLSVVAYDDLPSASHVRPALTTIRQDTRQAGAILVEKLFQAIDGGRPTPATLPTEIVIRDT